MDKEIQNVLAELGLEINENTIFVFDFDNTMYLESNSTIIEDFINEYVVFDLLLDGIKQNNQQAINYLKDMHGISDIDSFLKKVEEDNNYKHDLINLVAKNFENIVKPRYRTVVLRNFGFKPEQFYPKYVELSKFASIFYDGIKNNYFMKHVLEYYYKKSKAIIYTDNSRENVVAGLSMLGYDDSIIKNLPILAMFKENDRGDIVEMSTKRHGTAVQYLVEFLKMKGFDNIDLNNIIFFDDSESIIKNMCSSGIRAVLVKDNILTYLEKSIDVTKLQENFALSEVFKNIEQSGSEIEGILKQNISPSTMISKK